MSFDPETGEPRIDTCAADGCGRRTIGPRFLLCKRCYSREHGLHMDTLAEHYRKNELARKKGETVPEHIARYRAKARELAGRIGAGPKSVAEQYAPRGKRAVPDTV